MNKQNVNYLVIRRDIIDSANGVGITLYIKNTSYWIQIWEHILLAKQIAFWIIALIADVLIGYWKQQLKTFANKKESDPDKRQGVKFYRTNLILFKILKSYRFPLQSQSPPCTDANAGYDSLH